MAIKPKIALLVPWIKSKGGVERDILIFLKDKRYDIDVFTFFYDKKKTFEEFGDFDIKVIGKAKGGAFLSRGVSLFRALLSSKIPSLDSYDAFVISTAGIAEFAVFRNRHRLTVAVTHTPLRAAHNMYEYYSKSSAKNRLILPFAALFYKFLEKRAWRRIRYAIVFSDEVRRRLIQYRLIDWDRIIKISPPVDYRNIKVSRKHRKIIFYPSRFVPYKRQHLAVYAFKASKLPQNGFKLVLGGFPEDRKYFESIKAMSGGDVIVRENLSEKELSRLYRDCYATMFLAVNEDTGLVPLESLAYGKPVVAVNEGGPKEFVNDGVNGMLAEADTKSIARALDSLLDRRLYASMVKGAIKSERHDESRMSGEFDRAMDSILGKKG